MSQQLHSLRVAFAVLVITAFALPASAAIPASERATLLALYDSTNGDDWTDNSGWGDIAGTECFWHGIFCNSGGDHVIAINLFSNNLVGTLPDLSGLTSLTSFDVPGNQLTGTIPNLSDLTALQQFRANDNQLIGSIPGLSALTALQGFTVSRNELTGAIPDLSDLTSLRTFNAQSNELSGTIPDLLGLTSLQEFNVGANQLTGTIPDVSGLMSLQYFVVGGNQLTGTVPDLKGMTSLIGFGVSGNQLTGTIPDLSGLVALGFFFVNDNYLSGNIPDLSGLTSLEVIRVDDNQLTGTPPAAPANLVVGGSGLCPNFLHTPSPTDAAWNAATGETPWSQNCTPGYLVTPIAGMGGSITPTFPHAIVSGETDTLTITPNAGYAVQFVGGSCGGSFDSGNGTYITMPITQDCTVTAIFYLMEDVIFRDGFDS